MKMPKNYLKKDYRDKAFTGHLIGYAEEGAMGYELYIPDLQETIVGVHCTFNEIIPSYSDEYFNELNKRCCEVAKDESTIESLHL